MIYNDINDVPLFRYPVLYADPAWDFKNWSEAGEGKNAKKHYDCMPLDQIKALPVGHIAARDALLFMWVTDPTLEQAFEVIKAWGAVYKTVAFTWAKRTSTGKAWAFGPGYYTRANPEMCLLATFGEPGRPKDMGVRQLVVEPLREHSRKPDRIITDIERMYDGPYLELFSRTQRPGWDCWGNEATKFDE